VIDNSEEEEDAVPGNSSGEEEEGVVAVNSSGEEDEESSPPSLGKAQKNKVPP
jgi:hypothetical protein